LGNDNNNEYPDNNVSGLVIFLIANAFHFEWKREKDDSKGGDE